MTAFILAWPFNMFLNFFFFIFCVYHKSKWKMNKNVNMKVWEFTLFYKRRCLHKTQRKSLNTIENIQNIQMDVFPNSNTKRKKLRIVFRFLVSFSRKTKPKTVNQRKRNHQQHQKSRRGRRKIAPAFYPPLFIYYRDINREPETPPAFYMTAITVI